MAGWSPARIPDLTGRAAVVTGANSGLGFQTALQLAAHGATTILACRDQARGADAARRIKEAVPRATLEVQLLDLSDLSSIESFAARLNQTHDGLDLLVNNAGVMNIPFRRTRDGFEMQFGTNHLGHFALTGRLLTALTKRPEARVVTVSSIMARIGEVQFDNLQGERSYDRHRQYGFTKLANQLFMLELDRRARRAGTTITSVAAHPGYAATNLQFRGPEMDGDCLQHLFYALGNRLIAQSDARGAWPSLRAATSQDVEGGQYYGPGGIGGLRGRPILTPTVRAARDNEVATRLWSESERLTKVSYDLAAKSAA